MPLKAEEVYRLRPIPWLRKLPTGFAAAVTRRRVLILRILAASLALVGLWLLPRVLSLFFLSAGSRAMDRAVQNAGLPVPPDFACSTTKATSLARDKTMEQSIHLLQISHFLSPNNSHSNLQLGRAYCFVNRPGEAVQYLRNFIKLRPNNPSGHLEAGFAYAMTGDFQAAVSHWKIAGIKGENFLATGDQIEKGKSPQEAISWYQWAQALQPGWNQPSYQASLAFQKIEDWDKALETLEEGISQSQEIKGVSNLYYGIGYILQYHKTPAQTTNAWMAYEEAVALDDFSFNNSQKAATYLNRGVLLAWQGKLDAAIIEYETSLALNPKLYWSYLGLARARWQKGQKEEAYQLANTAISLDPNTSHAYAALGDFYRADGDIIIARKMYEKALQLPPELNSVKEALDTLDKIP